MRRSPVTHTLLTTIFALAGAQACLDPDRQGVDAVPSARTNGEVSSHLRSSQPVS